MYGGYNGLLLEKQDNILIIKFNNPKKKNCVNLATYQEISSVMRTAAKDESVVVIVLTGVGEYFTAGNDLSQTAEVSDIAAHVKKSNEIFKEMISSIIDCPKLIIALVNGPAIGVGATMAVLCDVTWCSDTAYFLTPFTKLGLVPEACSSYLFPLIMGRSKAAEMLLFSEKLTAEEAYSHKLVSKVFTSNDLNTKIWPKIREYAQLPPESMLVSKKILRSQEKDAMYRSLYLECEELHKRFFTEEFMNAMLEFAMRKNKSKL